MPCAATARDMRVRPAMGVLRAMRDVCAMPLMAGDANQTRLLVVSPVAYCGLRYSRSALYACNA